MVKVLFRFPIHIRIDQNHNTGIWGSSNWIWKSLEGSDPKLKKEHVFPLKSWITQFVGGFLMFLGHTIYLLVMFDLPLKFGSKRSTLNFWVFGSRAQFLVYSQNEMKITLEEKPSGILQIGEFILSPLEEMNKTQKSFRNRRILIFSAKFCQNSVFCKNRGDFLLT